MLTEFIQQGKSKGFLLFDSLKNILIEEDKKANPSGYQQQYEDFKVMYPDIEVADMDKIKDNVVREQALPLMPKSADGIKFILTKNRMDFIEVKRFIMFSRRIATDAAPEQETKIAKMTSKFKFEKEMNDCIFIMNMLVTDKSYFAANPDQIKQFYDHVEKNFIIATDCDFEEEPEQELAVMFVVSEDFTDRLEENPAVLGKIKVIFNKEREAAQSVYFNKPKLMMLNELEYYYNEIDGAS